MQVERFQTDKNQIQVWETHKISSERNSGI